MGSRLYANDNPYRYTDPDGRCPVCGTGYYSAPLFPEPVVLDAAANMLQKVGDAVAPLPPDLGGPELHAAIVPLVGALRDAASAAIVAEVAGDAAKISGKAQITCAAG